MGMGCAALMAICFGAVGSGPRVLAGSERAFGSAERGGRRPYTPPDFAGEAGAGAVVSSTAAVTSITVVSLPSELARWRVRVERIYASSPISCLITTRASFMEAASNIFTRIGRSIRKVISCHSPQAHNAHVQRNFRVAQHHQVGHGPLQQAEQVGSYNRISEQHRLRAGQQLIDAVCYARQ